MNFKKAIQTKNENLKFKSTLINLLKIVSNLFAPILTATIIISSRMYLEEGLYPAPFQLLTLVVMFHSLTGKFYAGVSATFITTLGAHFFLMHPAWEFKLTQSTYLVPTLEFFIQSIIIAYITSKFIGNLRELRKTSKNLEYARQKFKYVSEENTTLFAVTSTDGTVLEVNKAFSILVPGGETELLGNKIYECPPWNNATGSKDHLIKTIENITDFKTSNYEDILYLAEETKIYVNVSVTLINTDDSNPFLIISASDISDKKKSEKSAKKEQALFSNFIHSNIVGLIFTDSQRHITNANRKFLKMLGYKLSEVKEKKLELISVVPVTYHQQKSDTIKKILKYGYGGPIEIEIAHKDGSLVPVLLSGIIVDPDEKSFLFLFVDLTEQKKLERKKDEFISIASHEIKTPLTIIKGYLQLLNQKSSINNYKDFPKYMSVLTREVNKLTDLLNVMLDISRIETNKFKLNIREVDIVDHTKKSVLAVEPMLKGRIIKFESDMKELTIEADPNRINQVTMNLLTNAIKHSQRKGEIIVSVKEVKNGVKISVQDFGKGIHEEKLDKIFTKFFQIDKAKGNIEGLGLGLFISKEIVKAHHGQIDVASEFGHGATFSYTLPQKQNS
ncbi:MAG TPA: ATP-binding protein [Candidatus Dojkabacteria bacterium]|nr:ATP-binding protein [Candidatus Dojkabacteria bacterium]HRO65267.1 ATP-binding protein [Candidatus Dojkabacteria bacterium]HRP50839.1 ATP-binding protein [Candidatus Dojkabacteria bacterium]